jgi:hypothetical protein
MKKIQLSFLSKNVNLPKVSNEYVHLGALRLYPSVSSNFEIHLLFEGKTLTLRVHFESIGV